MGFTGLMMKGRLKQVIASQQGFTSTAEFCAKDGASAISIDQPRQQICFVKRSVAMFKESIEARIFKYSDLIECEIVEDGYTREKTSGMGTLGRSIVGGALGGGVGMLVGGLGAEKKTTKTVTRIDLKVVVNDTKDPCWMICFSDMEAKRGTFTGDHVYREASAEATRWFHILDNIIKSSQTSIPSDVVPAPTLEAAKMDVAGSFEVHGVDKESGFDTMLVIDADSPDNARVKAELKGIVVTKVMRCKPN